MVDAGLRTTIVNLFKAWRDELKISIVDITQDRATAYATSDRIIVMQKGQDLGERRRAHRADRGQASLLDPAQELGAPA
jgi:ABC-type dipeptide/oligopeptide/nickel transport system ATPase subunit